MAYVRKGTPRGRPSKMSLAARAAGISKPTDVKTKETDAQIEAKLAERFEALELLTRSCIQGHSRSLIVSGPGGLGKSFTVEKVLKDWDPQKRDHVIVKGFIRATGLYQTLYAFRSPKSVIVFDDADALFFEQESLGLLKCVCDTTESRFPSWLAETKMVDDNGVQLPRSFLFEGTIIFISNYDFDQMVEKGNRLAPHLEALISRSHYIDLAMKTRRDYIVRIRQVIKQGLLDHLSAAEKSDTVAFIEKNIGSLRELSLRIALKVGALRRADAKKWQLIAKITCCKNAA